MGNQQARHYVYVSFSEDRAYIGNRTCFCEPSEDTAYFGSYTDKSFMPTSKIILSEFATKLEAEQAEIELIKQNNAIADPYFANRGYFVRHVICTPAGLPRPQQHKDNISAAVKKAMQGPEVRAKISAGLKEWHRHNDHPKLGSKVSAEQNAKMVATRRATDGYRLSAEARAKLKHAANSSPKVLASRKDPKRNDKIRASVFEYMLRTGKSRAGKPVAKIKLESAAKWLETYYNASFND